MIDNPTAGEPPALKPVWDIPTRVFHWLLAALVITGWLLGEFGPPVKTWHFYCGYAIGTLVVLRMLRGIFGAPPNNFVSFLYGPKTTLKYALSLFSRKPSHWPGHNPMGGWSVFAMLLLLAVQVSTGLFASDKDYISDGPLNKWVSSDMRLELTYIHNVNAKILLAVIGLHVFMILFYLIWKRENLVGPMLTGKKQVRTTTDNETS